MSEQTPISLFVKLEYWDVYRLNAVLTATVFRKVLYIWGVIALLWLSISALLEVGVCGASAICLCSAAALRTTSVAGRPRPKEDWNWTRITMRPIIDYFCF